LQGLLRLSSVGTDPSATPGMQANRRAAWTRAKPTSPDTAGNRMSARLTSHRASLSPVPTVTYLLYYDRLRAGDLRETAFPSASGSQVFQHLRCACGIHWQFPMDMPVGPDYGGRARETACPLTCRRVALRPGLYVRWTEKAEWPCRKRAACPGQRGTRLAEVQQAMCRKRSGPLNFAVPSSSADVVRGRRLRTVRVYVVGEVGEPGAYDISSRLKRPCNAARWLPMDSDHQRGSLRFP